MFLLCWSAKGGTGTTVVASSLAVSSARHAPTVVIDLGGDVPACLGCADRDGDGLLQWLERPADDDPLIDGHRLLATALDAAEHLEVVPAGTAGPVRPGRDAWERIVTACTTIAASGRTVVVDASGAVPPPVAHHAASASLVVVRSCYLTLRRVARLQRLATGAVLITEPVRALGRVDVERALEAPVVAEIPWDPAVSRAVDSGLFATRLPGVLRSAVDRLVDQHAEARR